MRQQCISERDAAGDSGRWRRGSDDEESRLVLRIRSLSCPPEAQKGIFQFTYIYLFILLIFVYIVETYISIEFLCRYGRDRDGCWSCWSST